MPGRVYVMGEFSRRQGVVLAFMTLASLVVLAHSVMQVLSPGGATDFHSYWYYGHFVRMGLDPYQVYFEGVQAVQAPTPQPGLANTPANTAPLVLALSVFSWLPWEQAKVLWLLVNLALTLWIPGMVIALLPGREALTAFSRALLYFVFFALQGTRIANWVGQTTLLVFALMLGALLLRREHKVWAGVCLGFALSKYSLAMAVFLFLWLHREYLILALGVAVQALGVLIVSLLGGHSPLITLQHYVKMVERHAPLPGIHAASLAPGSSAFAAAVVLAAVLALILFYIYYGRQWKASPAEPGVRLSFMDLHALAFLLLWSLLAVYHRAYDTVVVIVFLSLFLVGLWGTFGWRLREGERKVLAGFVVVFVVVMSLPSSLMGFVLPAQVMPRWYAAVSYGTTGVLVLALAVTAWLLGRIQSCNT